MQQVPGTGQQKKNAKSKETERKEIWRARQGVQENYVVHLSVPIHTGVHYRFLG